MSTRVFWMHEDAMSLSHPVFEDFIDGDVVCFVWDAQYLKDMDYSFQRLVFIYETLCEMGVEIIRGPIVDAVAERARLAEASVVHVPATLNPALQAKIDALRRQVHVEEAADTPFVDFDRPPKLRRFYGYWKKARPYLMRP